MFKVHFNDALVFLQRKMCSKRDVFYHSSAKQSFAQGVACDRHQIILVIVLPSPLENSYSLQQLWVSLGSLSH